MREYNFRDQKWEEVESQDVYRFRSPNSGAKAGPSAGCFWVLMAVIGLVMCCMCVFQGCATHQRPNVSVKPVLVLSPTRIVKFATRQEVDGKMRLGAWASWRAEVFGNVQWCPAQIGWFFDDGSHLEPADCPQKLWTETRFFGPGAHGVKFALVTDYGEKFLLVGEVDIRMEGQ